MDGWIEDEKRDWDRRRRIRRGKVLKIRNNFVLVVLYFIICALK